MKKNITIIGLLTALIFSLILAGCKSQKTNQLSSSETYAISFTDDEGRNINLNEPCTRIISLYSAHTENLFILGAGESLIGNYKTGIYPEAASKITMYDYNSDPEKVIAANPDCVIIRPFITRKSPEFVKALENAGIKVVSLYPESYDDFPEYINRLAMLVGKEDEAKKQLTLLNDQIMEIEQQTKDIEKKQTMFFESTETNIRTVTEDSMPGLAIKFAGGINIAVGAEAIEEGSTIAPFGEENIMKHANDIDVYVSQRGAMNCGGSIVGISEKAGYYSIKAIQDNRVFKLNEKLISSPTFRYYKGIRELARFMYPEEMDNYNAFRSDKIATKKDFAYIIVKISHTPLFVPSSSKYYDTEYEGHTYGMFKDVDWQTEEFDFIETAVKTGAVEEEKLNNEEYFYPEKNVTREDLAKAAITLGNYSFQDNHEVIKDLKNCSNSRLVQLAVDNGVLNLIDDNFEPTKKVTNNEIINVLEAAVATNK
jgi:iron complex transport system substrate-binding protein